MIERASEFGRFGSSWSNRVGLGLGSVEVEAACTVQCGSGARNARPGEGEGKDRSDVTKVAASLRNLLKQDRHSMSIYCNLSDPITQACPAVVRSTLVEDRHAMPRRKNRNQRKGCS